LTSAHNYSTPEFGGIGIGLVISTPLASIALLLVAIGVFSVMAYTSLSKLTRSASAWLSAPSNPAF
jgi:hypothetical protein